MDSSSQQPSRSSKRARTRISPVTTTDTERIRIEREEAFEKLVMDARKHSGRMKKLLLADLADPDSVLHRFPSQHGNFFPPPSFIGKFVELEALASGMMEWSQKSVKQQAIVWTEYAKLDGMTKIEFKQSVYKLEKKLHEAREALYKNRIASTTNRRNNSNAGTAIANATAVREDVVPEHGSNNDTIIQSVSWVGRFSSQEDRDGAADERKALADSKTNKDRSSGHPATKEQLLLHTKSVKQVLKEVAKSSDQHIGTGLACNSMYIHMQTVDWTKKKGKGSSRNSASNHIVHTLDNAANTSKCRFVVVTPSEKFARRAMNPLLSGLGGSSNYEMVFITDKDSADVYEGKVDDERKRDR